MNRYSILIIEENLSVAAALTQVIGNHMDEYCLDIVKDVAETIQTPATAELILINLLQLTNSPIHDTLTTLQKNYPDVPIVLLQEKEADHNSEDRLVAALTAGAVDYVPLTKAGYLTLGQKLVGFRDQWQVRQLPAEPPAVSTLSQPLDKALAEDTTDLGMQIIDADNRIQVWNRAAEIFFGLPREKALGRQIEELPLSPQNSSRLKDILDQARITGEAFSIANYPLEDNNQDIRWVRTHVYPLRNNPLAHVNEVCIISTDVTDLKQAQVENWQYSQELQILLETSRESSKHLELQRTLEQFIDQTKTLLNADNCSVYFLEKDNQTLRPALAIGPMSDQLQDTPLKIGEGIIGTGITSGKAIKIDQNKISLNGRHLEVPYHTHQHLLYAPLTALNGMIGMMVVSRHKSSFEEDDLRFFENLVQQGSSAINNARLFEETHRNLNELAILYEASAAISTTWNTQTVLNTLIKQMVQALTMSGGHIAGWDKKQNTGTIHAGYPADQIDSHQTISLTERPALLTAVRQQRPTVFQSNNPLLDEMEQKHMAALNCPSLLIVPLVVKGETIGWTELWERQKERIFTADEVRLARALANQVAVALENAQYLNQTQQTLEETTALYQVASALTNTQDSHAMMSTVLHEYLHVLDLKQGSIIIFNFELKSGVVKVHIQDQNIPVNQSSNLEGRQVSLGNNPLYARLMHTQMPVKVEDTQAAWLKPRHAATENTEPGGGWAGLSAQSMLVIPIQIRGEIIGALIAEDTHGQHTFGERQVSLGQMMADQLGVALQSAQLYELEYKRRQQAETLREVSFAVSSSLNLNEVLKRIMDQLNRVVQYDRAAIHLIENNRRRIIATRGFASPEKLIGLTFSLTDTSQPEFAVIDKHQPLVLGNATDAYEAFRKPPYDSHVQSWMGVPLIARDKVVGLISIAHANFDAYQEEDVQLAMAFANQVAIALENARLYELEVRELESELEIAHGIQETLLPQFVPQVPGLRISGRSLPARQIGGDFFHFFSVGEDQLGVAIGDVSGKGIPAALYMAAAITAIDIKINDGLPPADLLNHMNRTLYNRLQENKMNIGLQIATFAPLAPPGKNKNTGEKAEAHGSLMTVSSGGMIAPIGATEHGCRFLPVSGFPIGSFSPDQLYHEDIFLLDPFTTIIFTSDGIVEAQNEQGELFGFERLEAAINEIISNRDPEVVAEHIIQTATDFMGEAEQGDDMTVVVVVKT